MGISDTQKTDFLWKKVVYGATDTTTTGKQGYEEAIGSRPTIFSSDIWSVAVPVPAPNATGSVVQYYPTSAAFKMTADPTVAGGKAWIAASTFGDVSTRVGDWVSPSADAGYLIEVYKTDATVSGNKLNQSTANNEWVFDYSSGVLQFLNTVPTGVSGGVLYIVAHRYIGNKGVGGAGVNEADREYSYSGSTVSTGTVNISNFFAHSPQSGTVTIMFNGVRVENADWSNTGTTLNLIMDNIPYPLENGDVISSRYCWAA